MKLMPAKHTKKYFTYAIKTAVAGILSLGLSRIIHLAEGYWAAISAIIVMQSNVGAAVNAAWSRLAGTAIGAAIAAIIVLFWNSNVVSFGIAVTLTVLICVSLGLMESYRLAAVTVAIVMLVANQGSPVVLALHRFLEVSLGIIVALLVSTFLWPSRARSHLRKGIADALLHLNSLFQAVIQRFLGETDMPVDELRARVTKIIIRNNELLKQAMYEPSNGPVQIDMLITLVEHTRQIRHAVESLVLSARENTEDTLYQRFQPEMSELINALGSAMNLLAEGVTSWRFDFQMPDLSGAMSALEKKAVTVRETGVVRAYDMNAVLHIYSFMLGLRNLAMELNEACEAGGHGAHLN